MLKKAALDIEKTHLEKASALLYGLEFHLCLECWCKYAKLALELSFLKLFVDWQIGCALVLFFEERAPPELLMSIYYVSDFLVVFAIWNFFFSAQKRLNVIEHSNRYSKKSSKFCDCILESCWLTSSKSHRNENREIELAAFHRRSERNLNGKILHFFD